MPKYDEDDDDYRPYSLASEPPVGVSRADDCTSKLEGDKREAVKSYVNSLGPKLRENYGKKDNYTPEQVQQTVLVGGMNIDYMCWAYVIYCTPSDFARIHSAAGEVCDYSAMREAVGGAFFRRQRRLRLIGYHRGDRLRHGRDCCGRGRRLVRLAGRRGLVELARPVVSQHGSA